MSDFEANGIPMYRIEKIEIKKKISIYRIGKKWMSMTALLVAVLFQKGSQLKVFSDELNAVSYTHLTLPTKA